MAETDTRVRSPRWRTIAVIWLACGLFDAGQTVLVMRAVGKHAWLVIFATELVSWLPWVLATPFIIDLARRRPLTRAKPASTAALHLASFLAVTLAAGVWFAVLKVLFNPWGDPENPTFMEAWTTSFPYQLLPYLTYTR